jgi:hypothetical protein
MACTGHNRCPSQSRGPEGTAGATSNVAPNELAKPVFVSRGGKNFRWRPFGTAGIRQRGPSLAASRPPQGRAWLWQEHAAVRQIVVFDRHSTRRRRNDLIGSQSLARTWRFSARPIVVSSVRADSRCADHDFILPKLALQVKAVLPHQETSKVFRHDFNRRARSSRCPWWEP